MVEKMEGATDCQGNVNNNTTSTNNRLKMLLAKGGLQMSHHPSSASNTLHRLTHGSVTSHTHSLSSHSVSERERVVKKFLKLSKTTSHGFISKSSAMDIDSILKLIAIATDHGLLCVFGKDDVEISSTSSRKYVSVEKHSKIVQVTFIEGSGMIVTLHNDNIINLWQLPNNEESSDNLIKLVRQNKVFSSENRESCVSVISTISVNWGISNSSEDWNRFLHVGTETGDVFNVELCEEAFNTIHSTISQTHVVTEINEKEGAENKNSTDIKLINVNPGPVEAILVHPKNKNCILIGYNRGVMVLWDLKRLCVVSTYVSVQEIQSISFQKVIQQYSSDEVVDKFHIVSSHNDGSYTIWTSKSEILNHTEMRTMECQSNKMSTNTPYGPFPCKAITQIEWLTVDVKENERVSWLIFCGGMARSDYGDKFTVSVVRSESTEGVISKENISRDHVVFDCTSKVLRFQVLKPSELNSTITLFILCEEDLVVINLYSRNESHVSWFSVVESPYLLSIHASAITTFEVYGEVCVDVIKNLENMMYERLRAKSSSIVGKKSSKSEKMIEQSHQDVWPLNGGCVTSSRGEEKSDQKSIGILVVTGHEDGHVKFWKICDSAKAAAAITHLTSIQTKLYFKDENDFMADEMDVEKCSDGDSNDSDDSGSSEGSGGEENDEDELWPPFHKVGSYDPFSDDPRFAVKQVSFCSQSGLLVVGGTAGHVLTYPMLNPVNSNTKINGTSFSAASDFSVQNVELVSPQSDEFKWKGHTALQVETKGVIKRRLKSAKSSFQFSLSNIVQFVPPAALNSLAYDEKTKLLAAGTAHGFIVYDLMHRVVVVSKCTLTPNDIANSDDCPISRRKSLKKSLRESFRRLRRGRSQMIVQGSTETNKMKTVGGSTFRSEVSRVVVNQEQNNDVGDVCVERQVEARQHNNSTYEGGCLGSMVRCLNFAQTFIVNQNVLSDTLWAGTHSGQVFIYLLSESTLTDTPASKSHRSQFTAVLAKEIQLKHKAPVIAIHVVDSLTGFSVAKSRQTVIKPSSIDHSVVCHQHRVIIVSEEQFKMFSLPSLKACSKYKLTANEGSKLRSSSLTSFIGRVGDKDLNKRGTQNKSCEGVIINSSVTSHASQESNLLNCLIASTNLGQLVCVSLLPSVKKLLITDFVNREDVIAISMLKVVSNGEAYYISSSSELTRATLSSVKEQELSALQCFVHNIDQSHAEAFSKSSARVQNESSDKGGLNHVAGGGIDTSGESLTTSTTPVNETAVSDVSSGADLTIDSVRDHLNNNGSAIHDTSKMSKGSESVSVTPPPTSKNESVTSLESSELKEISNTEEKNGDLHCEEEEISS